MAAALTSNAHSHAAIAPANVPKNPSTSRNNTPVASAPTMALGARRAASVLTCAVAGMLAFQTAAALSDPYAASFMSAGCSPSTPNCPWS
jgi:hypothetical protein